MRRAWVLVFAIACSPNPKPQPERVKDAIPQAGSSDAAVEAAKVDAMPAGPTPEEIDAALASLGSEHGAADIRNLDWWRTNAAHVRPYLRAMLEDGKDNMQSDRWAIRILGDIGDAADVELLATVLTTWKLDTARMAAASALGVHPAPAATDALIAATKHDNVETAAYATTALGERKNDAAARTRLEQLLDHTDSTVRYRAVNALAALGGSRPALEKRKKLEKDADVRSAINKALKTK
ncbi:MAG TPA: HEAT repeat domain-containing protein [Kofleriaceae bacterium]